MADIFLSYARADSAAAERVARALCKTERTVWYDSDLPAHRAYSDVIERELEGAGAVLVLWSKAAVQSQWVRSEANRARELDKLVQARLDDARLPMPFDQVQCADLSGGRQPGATAGWQQIQRSIDALAGRGDRPGFPATGGLETKSQSRRAVLIGAAAAAVAAAGGTVWSTLRSRERRDHIPPETAALMEQAKLALWQNTPEGQNQAIAIYRQVIAAAPGYADAWGRLAHAYAMTGHWRGAAEAAMLWERAQSAAQRALAMDERDAPAMMAAASAKPFMGNWLPMERDLRQALARWPRDGEIAFTLAMVLSMAGRNREAVEHANLLLPEGPTPGVYVFHAQMLWSAGREEDLDNLLDRALKLYPTHFGVWFTRFYTQMMGGRPEAALALAADTADRPTGISSEQIDAVVRVAKAIESRSARDIDAVTSEWMERAHHGAGYAENAAQFMASLGRIDDAYNVLRAYYFSEGFDCGEVRFERAIGSFTSRRDRQTAFLFNPAMGSVRSDPRFGQLTHQLGFADYWRKSGHAPDYLAAHGT